MIRPSKSKQKNKKQKNKKKTTKNQNQKKKKPKKKKKRERTCQIVDFAVPADHRVKIEKSEKKYKFLDFASKLKIMEHKGNGDTNCNWRIRNHPQRISKETGRLGNKRTSRDHPDYSTSKIGQNTDNSPGDLRRFAVIQIPVKSHQLTLMWKTLKGVK